MVKSFPTELVERVVDYFADDVHALCILSLVSKTPGFMTRARFLIFNDLTVNICRDPRYGVTDCRTPRCLIKLSRLVKSGATTIPRSLRSLKLNGRGIGSLQYTNNYSIVPNAGGMDSKNDVIIPLFNHFQAVHRLEFIQLHWFGMSSGRSSQPIARCLSSVKELIIDDVGFYVGLQGFLSVLHSASNLDSLTLSGAHWPSMRLGFIPDNPSHFLILMINFMLVAPTLVSNFLYLTWQGIRRVKKMLRSLRPRWAEKQYRIPPLHHLGVDLRYPPDAELVISHQKALCALASLEIYSECTGADDQDILQKLLEAFPSISHLTLNWCPSLFGLDTAQIRPPILTQNQDLRTLHLAIANAGQSWDVSWAWLRDTLDSVTSPHLTHIRVTIDIPGDIPIPSPAEGLPQIPSEFRLNDLDDYLSGENVAWVKTLETVEVWLGVDPKRRREDPEEFKERIKIILGKVLEHRLKEKFAQCEQRGILSVRAKIGRWLERRSLPARV